MRADKLYEAALALLGEEEYSCEDLRHLRFRIINQALAMCLSAHNTILVSKGEKPIGSFAPVENDGDEIEIDENMALEVLCFYVAALLCADHDRDKANVLSAQADRRIKKYSKANFESIKNIY